MCDTVVALGDATLDGSVILAKNSDREPNEAQLVMRVPVKKNKKDEMLKCTYISVPQAAQTRELLLSRPFWMWGAEMGANASGVVIGNEAVFTRERYLKTGLTGMDLLRLALERSDSAHDALMLITELIARYGQGGNCGYRHKLLYHNSFIIADKKDAWVLETAGSHWAAERVRGVRSISNGLTIGEEYDLASRGLEDYALAKGYIRRQEPFNFRRAFSDTIITHFSKCAVRQSGSTAMLKSHYGAITPAVMMSILRSHGSEGSAAHPSRTDMGSICMHASLGPLRASQSTSALVAHLRPSLPVYWATASSGTCTGVFKPLYLTGRDNDYLSDDTSAHYSSRELWWRHEALHRQAIMKYEFWRTQCAPGRNALEEGFIREEAKIVKSARNKKSLAAGVERFSRECFLAAEKASMEWRKLLKEVPGDKGIPLRFRYFWRRQNRLARMEL